MAITEAYMAPGDFTVTMRTETPHLMKTVTRGGYLVITPQYLGDPRGYTDASLLAAARYTGIILDTRWRNGILTLEGAGMDWILGDLAGIGWGAPTVSYSGDTLITIIALSTGTGIIPRAFTIGAVTNANTYTGSHSSTETVKQVITQVMADTSGHYRINPNGSIDASRVTNNDVFLNDPEMVLTREGWGSDALWIGAPVDELESEVSIREWLSGGPTLYGITNNTIARTDTTSPDPTQEITGLEILSHQIRSLWSESFHVGDNVYVFDPGSGFTGSDRIWFRGRKLQPSIHRLHEVTWPPVDGMGFYYRPGAGSVDTDDWIDLTATVATEPARTATTYLRSMELVESEGG